jgi:autotransporter-associated beta strand protein
MDFIVQLVDASADLVRCLNRSKRTPRHSALLQFLVVGTLTSLVLVSLSRADSATWLENAISGDWSDPTNWSAGGPPNGPTNVASFSVSNQTAISLSASTEVNTISFVDGASFYTFTIGPALTLTISGAGILGTSSRGSFTTDVVDGITPGRGEIWFTGNASAGNHSFINNSGRATNTMSGGRVAFFDNSTAATSSLAQYGPTQIGGDGGRALFFNKASAGSAFISSCGGAATTALGDQSGRGVTSFYDYSSAANASIYGVAGEFCGAPAGGVTQFLDESSAGNANVSCFGSATATAPPGEIEFFDNSTADDANLYAREGSGGGNGGAIYFRDNSTGGTSSIELRGNGFLDISDHDTPGLTVGSLQGTGTIFLGARNLSITNGFSFGGVIQDGGEAGGAGGSLSKVGADTFFLENANSFSGGTVVSAGALYAVHDHALGNGNVTVLSGATLACQPFVSGATNDYIADTATLSIAFSSAINLIYHGTDTVGVLLIDGVVQRPGLYGGEIASVLAKQRPIPSAYGSGFLGTGKLLAQLPVAVSRKQQNGIACDIYLPVTGMPGIECRSGGSSKSYQVVIRFLNNATFTSVSVTSGDATVSNVGGNGTAQATIDLSAVADHQVINITVSGLNDGLGLRDLVIPMGVLLGDTTSDGLVNSSDVSQTKSAEGQTLTITNFRKDVTTNGNINSSDVAAVKSHVGTSLPEAVLPPRTLRRYHRHREPYLP